MKLRNKIRILNLALVLAVFFALGGIIAHAAPGDTCPLDDGTGVVESAASDPYAIFDAAENAAASKKEVVTTGKNVEINKNTNVKKDDYVYVSEKSDDGSVKQYVYKKIGNDQYVRCLSGDDQTVNCQTEKYTFTQLEEKKSDGGSIIKINAGGAEFIKGQEEKAAQESKAKVDSVSTALTAQILENPDKLLGNNYEIKDEKLKEYAKQQCKKQGIECSETDINKMVYNAKMGIAGKSGNAVMNTALNNYLYSSEESTQEQKGKAKAALLEPFANYAADGKTIKSYSYVDGAGKTHEFKSEDVKVEKFAGRERVVLKGKENCAGRDRCTIANDGQLHYVDENGRILEQLSGFDEKKQADGRFGKLSAVLSVPSHTICSFKKTNKETGKTSSYSSPCPDGCRKTEDAKDVKECLASADISYSGATKLLMGNEAYEQWLAKVDEIFKKYLPLTPDALSERMCKNFQQMPNGQNAAFVESPGGILNPAAHIQGERTTVLDIEINDTSLSETDCTANPESPECQQYSAASLTGTDETNTNTETAADEETGTNDLTTAAVMIDRITGKAAGLPSGSASGIDTITGAGTPVAYEDIEAGEGEEANFTIVRKYVYKITWFVKNVQVQGSDPTLEYQLVLKGPGVEEASNLKSLEEGASDGRAVTAPYTFADKRLFTSACLRFSKGYSKFKGMSGSELCNSIVDSSKKATVVDVGVPAGAQGSGAGSGSEAGKFAIPQI